MLVRGSLIVSICFKVFLSQPLYNISQVYATNEASIMMAGGGSVFTEITKLIKDIENKVKIKKLEQDPRVVALTRVASAARPDEAIKANLQLGHLFLAAALKGLEDTYEAQYVYTGTVFATYEHLHHPIEQAKYLNYFFRALAIFRENDRQEECQVNFFNILAKYKDPNNKLGLLTHSDEVQLIYELGQFVLAESWRRNDAHKYYAQIAMKFLYFFAFSSSNVCSALANHLLIHIDNIDVVNASARKRIQRRMDDHGQDYVGGVIRLFINLRIGPSAAEPFEALRYFDKVGEDNELKDSDVPSELSFPKILATLQILPNYQNSEDFIRNVLFFMEDKEVQSFKIQNMTDVLRQRELFLQLFTLLDAAGADDLKVEIVTKIFAMFEAVAIAYHKNDKKYRYPQLLEKVIEALLKTEHFNLPAVQNIALSTLDKCYKSGDVDKSLKDILLTLRNKVNGARAHEGVSEEGSELVMSALSYLKGDAEGEDKPSCEEFIERYSAAVTAAQRDKSIDKELTRQKPEFLRLIKTSPFESVDQEWAVQAFTYLNNKDKDKLDQNEEMLGLVSKNYLPAVYAVAKYNMAGTLKKKSSATSSLGASVASEVEPGAVDDEKAMPVKKTEEIPHLRRAIIGCTWFLLLIKNNPDARRESRTGKWLDENSASQAIAFLNEKAQQRNIYTELAKFCLTILSSSMKCSDPNALLTQAGKGTPHEKVIADGLLEFQKTWLKAKAVEAGHAFWNMFSRGKNGNSSSSKSSSVSAQSVSFASEDDGIEGVLPERAAKI